MARKLTHSIKRTDTKQVPSKLKEIIGVVKLPDDFDEKQELETYLKKKHLVFLYIC